MTSGSYDFTGYEVLVVGGTRGEGHAIASSFARSGASVTVTGGPAKGVIVFRRPAATKPMDSESGDQNGKVAFSVPLIFVAFDAPIGRSHSAALPLTSLTMAVTMSFESGEIATDPL